MQGDKELGKFRKGTGLLAWPYALGEGVDAPLQHLAGWSVLGPANAGTGKVLRSPGNPATISRSSAGLRPVALRPTLSDGLPFSDSTLVYRRLFICYKSDDPKRRFYLNHLAAGRPQHGHQSPFRKTSVLAERMLCCFAQGFLQSLIRNRLTQDMVRARIEE